MYSFDHTFIIVDSSYDSHLLDLITLDINSINEIILLKL